MKVLVVSREKNLLIIQDDTNMAVRPACHMSEEMSVNVPREELSCSTCGKLVDNFAASRKWATSWRFDGNVEEKTWILIEKTIQEWASAWLMESMHDVEVSVAR